jgi:hypothetical protein
MQIIEKNKVNIIETKKVNTNNVVNDGSPLKIPFCIILMPFCDKDLKANVRNKRLALTGHITHFSQ